MRSADDCIDSEDSFEIYHSNAIRRSHQLEIIKTLGEGTHGKVQLALDPCTGQKFAVKIITKKCINSERDKHHIRREIEIQSQLRHPNIIGMREVYESESEVTLVMEYASGGELFDHINDYESQLSSGIAHFGGLCEPEARKLFRQLVSVVDYLHKNGVVHRDLKLENILLDADGNAKLADFGLSTTFGHGHLLKTYCGSPLYASPEIVNGRPYVGPEVDCWSLGVMLYTMLYGLMPFDGADFRTLRRQITNGLIQQPAMLSDAHGLILHILNPTLADRANLSDILNHEWLRNNDDDDYDIPKKDVQSSAADATVTATSSLENSFASCLSVVANSDRNPPVTAGSSSSSLSLSPPFVSDTSPYPAYGVTADSSCGAMTPICDCTFSNAYPSSPHSFSGASGDSTSSLPAAVGSSSSRILCHDVLASDRSSPPPPPYFPMASDDGGGDSGEAYPSDVAAANNNDSSPSEIHPKFFSGGHEPPNINHNKEEDSKKLDEGVDIVSNCIHFSDVGDASCMGLEMVVPQSMASGSSGCGGCGLLRQNYSADSLEPLAKDDCCSDVKYKNFDKPSAVVEQSVNNDHGTKHVGDESSFGNSESPFACDDDTLEEDDSLNCYEVADIDAILNQNTDDENEDNHCRSRDDGDLASNDSLEEEASPGND